VVARTHEPNYNSQQVSIGVCWYSCNDPWLVGTVGTMWPIRRDSYVVVISR
jgi:hypothetical protein